MDDPVVRVVGWSVVLASLIIVRVATCLDESHTPKSFLETVSKDASPSTPPPVVCVGDSLTRCNLSADWVGALRQQLTEGIGDEAAAVLNAGVNMQCAINIQQRLNEVIECRPSHVTVLVGTNDMKAELSPVEGFMYRVFDGLPTPPTLESYETTLTEIRERLLATGARVAFVSPPVLGEDVTSLANQRAADFAAAVRRVALGGGDQCAYLPLYEETVASLPSEGGRPYCGLHFFAWLCMLCLDIHVLRRDMREVQRERNLGVTVDLVHLGPQAANRLAQMVADFVKEGPGKERLTLAPAT